MPVLFLPLTCSNIAVPPAGRGMSFRGAAASAGSLYNWGGSAQRSANVAAQVAMLRRAQTAYFVAVVIGKVAAVLVIKTRRVSASHTCFLIIIDQLRQLLQLNHAIKRTTHKPT